MAKRYKEKQKSKQKCIIFIIIIIIIAILIFVAIKNNWFNGSNLQEEKQDETTQLSKQISEYINKENKLNSNLLNPTELSNEVYSQLSGISQGGYIVKMHYKLKTLDDGNIDVYYKINDNELLKLIISVENKTVENMEEYKDDSLLEKEKITDNLNENIEEDFNRRKEDSENENAIVNIIITDTEIVINTSLE